ncbi:MgtC/SapB family protein [Maribacter sp. 2307ULW6-5]|uniref:MgtC/SapB family protein n=1 Tax=Maribacter sp. 2307ULW6-5 TaxID=3386275 RepID=UPI0039BCDB6D
MNAQLLIDFAIPLLAAMIGGLLIGLERELKGKSAGLKTNALVALGAAVFILISLKFKGMDDVDITRVLGQVVTGIGFLGAGVILQKENSVKGLTTAATVWCSAALGALAAFKMYWELVLLTASVVLVNLLFGYLDKQIGP